MAKPADNDATMEVSTSQLVPDAPRPRVMPPPISQNDMSVWKQVVVSTDDFAPPAKAPTGRGRRLLIAGFLLSGIASGVAVTWYRTWRPAPPAPAAAGAPVGAASPAAPAPAPGPTSAALAPTSRQSVEAAPASPAPDATAPAEPMWLEELASALAIEPPPMTWFEALWAALEPAFPAAPAPSTAKKPAAPARRTAATPAKKKPPVAPKKPAPAKQRR
jgi:hypothetical protein